jgi:hypothetical protein
MPGAHGKAGKTLGITAAFADERRRLQRVLDDAQLIFDEHRVAMTKQAAGEIYLDAGRAASDPTAGRTKAFEKLGTREIFKAEPTEDLHKAVQTAGKEFGLTAAETAAIATFTGGDYMYINPATENDASWMDDMFGHEGDSSVATRKEEGSLHTSMALSGLLKLPVWKGSTARGESQSLADFNSAFELVPRSGGPGKPLAFTFTNLLDARAQLSKLSETHTFRLKKKTFQQKRLVSSTRKLAVTGGFGGLTPKRPLRFSFRYTLTNGRDIQPLSMAPGEEEVVTLPGATFAYDSIRYDPPTGAFIVHCHQIR